MRLCCTPSCSVCHARAAFSISYRHSHPGCDEFRSAFDNSALALALALCLLFPLHSTREELVYIDTSAEGHHGRL